jgi:hypothetical protein
MKIIQPNLQNINSPRKYQEDIFPAIGSVYIDKQNMVINDSGRDNINITIGGCDCLSSNYSATNCSTPNLWPSTG